MQPCEGFVTYLDHPNLRKRLRARSKSWAADLLITTFNAREEFAGRPLTNEQATDIVRQMLREKHTAEMAYRIAQEVLA